VSLCVSVGGCGCDCVGVCVFAEVNVGLCGWVKVDVCGLFCGCSDMGVNGDFYACVLCVRVILLRV